MGGRPRVGGSGGVHVDGTSRPHWRVWAGINVWHCNTARRAVQVKNEKNMRYRGLPSPPPATALNRGPGSRNGWRTGAPWRRVDADIAPPIVVRRSVGDLDL